MVNAKIIPVESIFKRWRGKTLKGQSNAGAVFSLVAAITILIIICVVLINKTGMNFEEAVAKIFTPSIKLTIISKTGSNQDFFEMARVMFEKENKNIKIEFIPKSSNEAIDYICETKAIDAWVCADEAFGMMLNHKYALKNNQKDIVNESTPIVTSLLVILGWEDRLNKLSENRDLDLDKMYNVISQNSRWESFGGNPEWGRIKFSHTDPKQSNSAMQFIALLANNYLRKNTQTDELKLSNIDKKEVWDYISKFEKNVTGIEGGSGKLIDSIVQRGTSSYDFAAIYEYYALANIKNVKNKWGNIKIFYPTPTIWSNKSLIILNTPENTPLKIEALKKFRDFLLSSDIQKLGLKEGYRPANTTVDMSLLEKEFSQYGFKKQPPKTLEDLDMDVYEYIIKRCESLNGLM